MKKIAITGNFTGVVFAIFDNDEAETLVCLDVRQAELEFNQVTYLFRQIPTAVNALQAFLDKAKLKGVEVLDKVTFEDFYKEYGVKEGKKKAEAVWSKLSEAEQMKAYQYIGTIRTKKKISGEAMPYPATYLNQARWND